MIWNYDIFKNETHNKQILSFKKINIQQNLTQNMWFLKQL
jgi:hypothetical protein